ncbi:MAG: exonuclease SbcCD subunit D [Candidatus Thorarchaeota archaeon]
MKFLLTSDDHFRLDQPKCRTDNFRETQARKFKWIEDLAEKHNATILKSGDTFHKARISPEGESWMIKHMPKTLTITVAGNHDLPYHSINQYKDSSLSVLEACGKIIVLKGCENFTIFSSEGIGFFGLSWGNNLEEWIEKTKTVMKENGCIKKAIALMHIYVYNEKKYWDEDEVATKADSLMRKLPMFDLIITGHNHIPFVKQNGNQILINPGAITRQRANDNFRPRIYIWDSIDNKISKEYIPISEGVISIDHIKKTKEDNERLNELIEKFGIKIEQSAGPIKSREIDFLRELDNFYAEHEVDDEVKEMIVSCLA